MRMPHLSVTTSICSCTSVLMRSRSDSASSSVIVPMTDRSAVRASASMATSKFFTLNSACLASTTWVKIVALTVTTTLSLVMTSWRSPGTGISRMSTRLQRVDERDDDDEPGLVGLAVLAEPLDHADLALLHDVDRAAQRGQQHEHDQAEHDEPADGDWLHAGSRWSPSASSARFGRLGQLDRRDGRPSTGQTVERGASHRGDERPGVPAGIGVPEPLIASQRSPARRTWPRWWASPTASRVRTSSPTSVPCTPRPSRPSWRRCSASLIIGRTATMPTPATTTATATWSGMAVGHEQRRPRRRRRHRARRTAR